MSTSPMTPSSVGTIDSISRRVVLRCAPEEGEYHDRLVAAFYAAGAADPRRAAHPLGFGDVAVGFVTGIVLAVLNELATESLTSMARPWWKRMLAWFGTRLRRTPLSEPDTPIPALTARQRAAVASAIASRAVESGLSAEGTGRLVSSVLEELEADGDDGDV